MTTRAVGGKLVAEAVMESKIPMDDLPISSFHKRVAIVAGGGPFCDGYLLGIIAVALPLLTDPLRLSGLWIGLIASSSLIGLFVGGMVFGPLTDRTGRRMMYILNLAVFIVGSIAQFFVGSAWELFALRLIVGIAIGADYPIATAMATEYLPRKIRGPALSGLVLSWWIGYAVSFLSGYALAGLGGNAWRWMLLSGALPALVFLVMRAGIPESPRWLVAAGRRDEARTVVNRCLGADVDFDALVAEPAPAQRSRHGMGSVRVLFRRGYGPMLIFCSVFWMCQVSPSFALRTFQPQLLSALGIHHPLAASTFVMVFPVLGALLGMATVNRVGRRVLLLGTFAVISAALVALSIIPASIAGLTLGLYVLYNVAEAAGSTLQYVYPNELFPTELRATGMGIATGMSRIGSAAGTFLLPLTIGQLGAKGALAIAGIIGVVGLLVSWALAPETGGLGLAKASQSWKPMEWRGSRLGARSSAAPDRLSSS